MAPTHHEKKNMMRKSDPPPHGTYNAWMLHYRAKETPCDLCKQARNEYQSNNKKKNRGTLQKPGTPIFPSHPFDDNPNWTNTAACKGATEIFYPERGDNVSARKAKKICANCPIKQKCLEYALYHNERIGIWGGLTDRERERLKKQLKTS
jgi:WhiB family redox-sensing transcriptional regulator